MKKVARACAMVLAVAGLASAQTAEQKIAQAVKALPESMRDGASVVEYDADGYRTILREGTNSLVCESDDPDTDGFRVACYHKNRIARLNFERQLAATGTSAQEVFQARSTKVDAGELPLPVAGQMGYFLGGADEASAVPTRSVRLPYATSASTGPADRARQGRRLADAGRDKPRPHHDRRPRPEGCAGRHERQDRAGGEPAAGIDAG